MSERMSEALLADYDCALSSTENALGIENARQLLAALHTERQALAAYTTHGSPERFAALERAARIIDDESKHGARYVDFVTFDGMSNRYPITSLQAVEETP